MTIVVDPSGAFAEGPEQEVVAGVYALREALSWYDSWPLVVMLAPDVPAEMAEECRMAAAEHGVRVDRLNVEG